VNLALTSTVNDLAKNYTFSSSNWTQATLNVSGVVDVNGAGYTGVCVTSPPNKSIQSTPYQLYVCSAHTDCKYQVYSSGVVSAGNIVGGNYLCSNTDGFVCAQAASCHPVSHLCETGQSVYWNSACATCTQCGTSPTVCAQNSTTFTTYATCLKPGQNVSPCTSANNYTTCCF
jgi:hypothetical protein